MNNLLCESSNRLLREGDTVRIRSGSSAHRVGKVVGLSPLSETPIMVQYSKEDRYFLEKLRAQDIEFLQCSRQEVLEPLPLVSKLLAEDTFLPDHCTCGTWLGMRLVESGAMFSFVPLSPDVSLLEAYTEGGIESLIKNSFVTRIPDQVHFSLSKAIDNLIESERTSTEIVDALVGYASCDNLEMEVHNGRTL